MLYTIRHCSSGGAACILAATTILGGVTPASAAPAQAPDYTSMQWHLDSVRARDAWTVTQGAGIKVAVIDSGLEMSSEFAGRVESPAYWNGDVIVPESVTDMTDTIGHGTHVAGIIGAADDGAGVSGIAPQVTIVPVDISSAVSGGTLDDFARALTGALDYAYESGAKVVNMSLGLETLTLDRSVQAEAICKAVSKAIDRDMVVVVAAGNSGDSFNPLVAPAACPGALSVAALNPTLQPVSWTSTDSTVSLSAPGESILSTWPKSLDPESNGFKLESGTSMAAPIVAGVAALVQATHPNYSARQTIDTLTSTTMDIGPAGRDAATGYGVVNAGKAVGASSELPVPGKYLEETVVSDLNLAVFGYSECYPCAYTYWEPEGFTAESYLVTVTHPDGMQETHSVDGSVIREVVSDAGPGDWVQVTAVLKDGSTLPAWPQKVRFTLATVSLSSVTAKADSSGKVRVTWAEGSETPVLGVKVILLGNQDILAVRQAGGVPGRTSVTLNLPRRYEGRDITPLVVLTLQDGTEVSALGSTAAPKLPFSATLTRAGKGKYGIDGQASILWMAEHYKLTGCEATVKFPNAEYTTTILDDGRFTLVVPSSLVREGRTKFTVKVDSCRKHTTHQTVTAVPAY